MINSIAGQNAAHFFLHTNSGCRFQQIVNQHFAPGHLFVQDLANAGGTFIQFLVARPRKDHHYLFGKLFRLIRQNRIGHSRLNGIIELMNIACRTLLKTRQSNTTPNTN